jgi:hypothetical protein
MVYTKIDERYLELLYSSTSEIDLALDWEKRKEIARRSVGVAQPYQENFMYWQQVQQWLLQSGLSRKAQAYYTGLELFSNTMSDARQEAEADKAEKTYETKFKNLKNGLELDRILKDLEAELFGDGSKEAEANTASSIAESMAQERTKARFTKTEA